MIPGPGAPPRRGDIQGLRALSALIIVGFHVWTQRTSGAVDVFFVVSGFLLIGSLVRQVEQEGRIDLRRYAGGIWRRLLPATVVVTVITVAASQVLLPEFFWGRAAREGLATSLFIENLALRHYAFDYLARGDLPTPFQNGWAISLQVQAYVMIGLLMAGLARWARGSRHCVTRLSVALAVITLASFGWAARAVVIDPGGAYFDPFARLWEFSVGGLLAMVLARHSLPAQLRGPTGWTGLVLLLTTGLLWGTTRQFPAWASLWPVTAALLILAAGADGRSVGVGRLLAWRPLAWLGDRSYGLYLWQGPVLVFTLILTGQTRPDLTLGLLVFILSIGLAVVSKATLEKLLTAWLSAAPSFPRLTLRSALLVALMAATVGGWALHLSYARHNQMDQLATTRLTGRLPRVNGQIVIVPGPLVARSDHADAFDDDCLPHANDSRPLTCRYGPADAAIVIALVGSSHAAHWLPALQQIASERGWSVVTYTKASCAFGDGAVDNFERPAPDCAAWNAAVSDRLRTSRPALVITLATLNKIPPERITPGSLDRWQALGALGIPVLALRDTAWFDFDVPVCVDRHGATDPRCALPRALDNGYDLTPPGGWPANVLVIAPRAWLCAADHCPPVLTGRLVYGDDNHMTATFARSLAPRLTPWIDQALALRPVPVSPLPGPPPPDRSPTMPDRPGPSYSRP